MLGDGDKYRPEGSSESRESMLFLKCLVRGVVGSGIRVCVESGYNGARFPWLVVCLQSTSDKACCGGVAAILLSSLLVIWLHPDVVSDVYILVDVPSLWTSWFGNGTIT